MRNEEKEINQMDNNEEVAAVAENNTGIEIEPLFGSRLILIHYQSQIFVL